MNSFQFLVKSVYFCAMLVALLMTHDGLAQKQFVFNASGNQCYFDYVVFCPDYNYNLKRKPVVMVLGIPDQDPMAIFESDSLKNNPSYFNCVFVYIPTKTGREAERLDCLLPLRTLLVGDRKTSANSFVKIYSPAINDGHVKSRALSLWFKSIVCYGQISEQFEITEVIDEDDEEAKMGGVYYVEENAAERDVNEVTVIRNYFGPATKRDISISGIVRDKSTHESLPGANVKVKNGSGGAITNMDGFFSLHHVASDTSALLIQFVGYDKVEFHLVPNAPKNYYIIELSQTTVNLKGVTVSATREDVKFSDKEEVSAIRMTPRKLEVLPNIGERDVMRSFQLMPGISAANESSSGLYVRGGTPDQNLVLYEGFTSYHVDHLYGFFSAFNSNALKDVQVYKGGYESKFGGRLSSVTELTAKEGNQKRFNVGGDLSLLSMNAYIEAPIGDKFTSIIAFRKSYKGFLYDKIFDKFNPQQDNATAAPRGPGGMSNQTQATSYFYDLNGKFTYRPNQKDVLSLSFFNGTDKLDNSNSFDAPSFGGNNSSFSMSSTDLTKYGNIGSSLRWSRKWNDRLYSNTLVSYSNYYSDRDRSQERTETDADGNTNTVSNGIFENNDLRDYSAKSDLEYSWNKQIRLEGGLFASYYDIQYKYAQNDTSSILEKHNQSVSSGAYLQGKFRFFKEKLLITPGLRQTFFQSTNKFYTEPRLSFTYSISDRWTLKGATGKYYQMVNRVTREDILSGSRDFWLLSDGKSIPVSESVHYIAGLSYENNNYLLSVEGYYKKLDHLTEYSLRFSNRPEGTTVNENFYQGKGYAKGVEFLVQRKSGVLNGWVSYTLGQARNSFEIYSQKYYPANQDVTHEFKIVGTYKYKRWDFSATWIYATGRPYTAPSGAYALTLLDGSTQDFFTVTTKNGLRLPDYHRADVSATYKLLAGRKGAKKRREIGYVGFSIFNVYNRTNIWYKTYTIYNGDILETNVNYVGITPNITLSLKLR